MLSSVQMETMEAVNTTVPTPLVVLGAVAEMDIHSQQTNETVTVKIIIFLAIQKNDTN